MKKLAGTKLRKFNKRHKNLARVILILDNIEYARNVASIFNLAYALKVEEIILSGITTSPPFGKELLKVSRQREQQINWKTTKNIKKSLIQLKNNGYTLISIAKTENAKLFSSFSTHPSKSKIAIIVGNEKQGLSNSIISSTDFSVYVPVYRSHAHLNIVNELAVIGYNIISSSYDTKKN